MPTSSLPFDATLMPDLAAWWTVVGASDNGTTLTVPDRLGGAPMTATGVGRQTINPTYIDGRHPAIVCAGSTVALSASGSILDTATECTIYIVARATSKSSAANFWSYGDNYQQVDALWANSGTQFFRRSALGNRVSESIPSIVLTDYAQVHCFRASIPLDVNYYALDGREVGVNSGAAQDTSGTFGTGSFRLSGPTPFPGGVTDILVFTTMHSDAKKLRMSKYLRGHAGITCFDFLMFGDSITANPPSWREATQNLYDARDGFRFYRTVGRAGQGTTWPTNWCEAGGGNTIDVIRGYIAQSVGRYWFPDFSFFLIGSNDIAIDLSSPSTMMTKAGAMLDEHQALWPNRMALGTLIQRAGFNTQIDAWNDVYLPQVVAAARSRGIDVTLCTASGDTAVSTYDGTHPDQAGSTALGTSIWNWILEWAGTSVTGP